MKFKKFTQKAEQEAPWDDLHLHCRRSNVMMHHHLTKGTRDASHSFPEDNLTKGSIQMKICLFQVTDQNVNSTISQLWPIYIPVLKKKSMVGIAGSHQMKESETFGQKWRKSHGLQWGLIIHRIRPAILKRGAIGRDGPLQWTFNALQWTSCI